MVLSQPELTIRFVKLPGAALGPAGTAGAHETAVTPIAWTPGSFVEDHDPSELEYSVTEMVPSEEPAASKRPSS